MSSPAWAAAASTTLPAVRPRRAPWRSPCSTPSSRRCRPCWSNVGFSESCVVCRSFGATPAAFSASITLVARSEFCASAACADPAPALDPERDRQRVGHAFDLAGRGARDRAAASIRSSRPMHPASRTRPSSSATDDDPDRPTSVRAPCRLPLDRGVHSRVVPGRLDGRGALVGSRAVTIPDRVRATATWSRTGSACTTSSRATGPLVLLCHGFPELWYSWRYQLEPLAAAGLPRRRGRPARLRPLGQARRARTTSSGSTRASPGVITGLGHERAVLAGHDWGGLLVWPFARRYPELTAGVIGVNTPDLPADPDPDGRDAAQHLPGRPAVHRAVPGSRASPSGCFSWGRGAVDFLELMFRSAGTVNTGRVPRRGDRGLRRRASARAARSPRRSTTTGTSTGPGTSPRTSPTGRSTCPA